MTHDESRYSVNLLNGKMKTITGINEAFSEQYQPRDTWTNLKQPLQLICNT